MHSTGEHTCQIVGNYRALMKHQLGQM